MGSCCAPVSVMVLEGLGLYRRHVAGLLEPTKAGKARPKRLDWTLRVLTPAAVAGNRQERGSQPLRRAQRLARRPGSARPWPTRNLHVLADHHGNRSPRANPAARGLVVGLSWNKAAMRWRDCILRRCRRWLYGTRHIIEHERRRAPDRAHRDVRRRHQKPLLAARKRRRHRLRDSPRQRGRRRHARRRAARRGCQRRLRFAARGGGTDGPSRRQPLSPPGSQPRLSTTPSTRSTCNSIKTWNAVVPP